MTSQQIDTGVAIGLGAVVTFAIIYSFMSGSGKDKHRRTSPYHHQNQDTSRDSEDTSRDSETYDIPNPMPIKGRLSDVDGGRRKRKTKRRKN
jgi:hypothetical protein